MPATRERWRASSSTSSCATARRPRWSSPPCIRGRPTRSSRPRATGACAWWRARCSWTGTARSRCASRRHAGYEATAELIARWHGRDRLGYAVTPRFAGDVERGAAPAGGAAPRRAPGSVAAEPCRRESGRGPVGARAVPRLPELPRRLRPVRPATTARDVCPLHPHRRRGPPAPGGEQHRRRVLPDVEPVPGERALRPGRRRSGPASGSGWGPTSAAAPASACSGRSARPTRWRGSRGATLTPWRAFYLATLGGARALGLEAAIGSFQPGREADCVVLDPAATPLLARRMGVASALEDRLFAWMTLGDDRAVAAVHLLGRRVAAR